MSLGAYSARGLRVWTLGVVRPSKAEEHPVVASVAWDKPRCSTSFTCAISAPSGLHKLNLCSQGDPRPSNALFPRSGIVAFRSG